MLLSDLHKGIVLTGHGCAHAGADKFGEELDKEDTVRKQTEDTRDARIEEKAYELKVSRVQPPIPPIPVLIPRPSAKRSDRRAQLMEAPCFSSDRSADCASVPSGKGEGTEGGGGEEFVCLGGPAAGQGSLRRGGAHRQEAQGRGPDCAA